MSSPASELKVAIRHGVVKAGAGAGKTRSLVEKVYETFLLYKSQGLEPRIVLTTFTKKATQELKERLLLKACQEKDALFLQFVSDTAKLHISTIHGLLSLFLRQTGHLAGLDAGFTILGEGEALSLSRGVLREVILAHPHYLSFLEAVDFEAVLRMVRQFEKAKREDEGLTALGLEDLQRLKNAHVTHWKTQLKALCVKLKEIEKEDPLAVFGEQLLAFLESWPFNPEASLPLKPRVTKKTQHLDLHDETKNVLESFKDELFNNPAFDETHWPEIVAVHERFYEIANEFVAVLLKKKEALAQYEIADLELKTLELLREKPFLGTLFGDNWDFWMIDEFQDTSPVQVNCLKALIGQRPYHIVGDPQQSIYLFRGADVEVFSKTETEIQALGFQTQELKRNYRSESDLLLFINDFFKALSPQFKPMEPREQPRPSSRVAVQVMTALDHAQEDLFIGAHLQKLVEAGVQLDKICILARTHDNLMEVSQSLRALGYPTHVHAARGFSKRREVRDAQALYRFLINPHDNLNLLSMLRSPWHYVPDAQLAEWMAKKPDSLWTHLQLKKDDKTEAVLRLLELRADVEKYGIVRTFEKGLRTCGILDFCLKNDPSGRKESNIWKLIDRARELESDGGNPLDFLDSEMGSDEMESNEGDATSAQEPNCINLMTIHGSKGLEFDHVIIPRMGSAPRKSQYALLSVLNSKFSFTVSIDGVDKAVPTPLDYICKQQKQERELAEFDRTLYVAMTRAKDTLALVASEVKNGSWAQRAFHFNQEPGVYDKDFYSYEVSAEAPEPLPYIAKQILFEELRKPWSVIQQEKSAKTSASEILSDKKDSSILNPERLLNRLKAQRFGIDLHKQLETVSVRSKAKPNPLVKYVAEIQEPPMQLLLREGKAEWGFQVLTPKGVVEGAIDLWGMADGKLYIIDYKSGSLKESEKAFDQLSLYAWALRKFKYTEPMSMTVIYPKDQKVLTRNFTSELFFRWETEFGFTK